MNVPAELRASHGRLRRWLTDEALPLWWARDADFESGGFFDRLGLDGSPAPTPKRVRVQARQAHVYGLAAAHGWMKGADRACRHGLYALASMRRADGLYRVEATRTATPLDGMGELYDQAFALLALATGRSVLDEPRCERLATDLVGRLEAFRQPLGGYAEAPGLAAPLFANPNMHLFESFQAWAAISGDAVWRDLAAGQAQLALRQLIEADRGVLYEAYDAGWAAPAAAADRSVWPGHLYEWGFLLLRWPGVDSGADPACRAAALRLIEVADTAGVDMARGVAMFALDGDLQPIDRGARLWAQTERLRAVAASAALTGEARYWASAAEAAAALERFLDVPTPGLWRDWMDAAGGFREEPAPASSFYHIVGAIAELERLIGSGA